MMSVRKSLSMTSGVFLVVFALSFVSAQNDSDLSNKSDVESFEEMLELLQNIQVNVETKIASKVQQETVSDEDVEVAVGLGSFGCMSSGFTTTCCQYLKYIHLELDGVACVIVTYLKSNDILRVTLQYANRILFSWDVSATKPPPLCVEGQLPNRDGSICIEFYNIHIAEKSFSACTKLRTHERFAIFYVYRVEFGCFEIGTYN